MSGSWVQPSRPAPYQPPPRDQRIVHVVASERPWLLHGERVEVGVRTPVPKWLADDLTAARPDIRIVD
jgi:hypothetical protein